MCIFSFVGFIASKLLFGPIVTTAATGILEQLTIFSVGVALGVAYRNGDTQMHFELDTRKLSKP